MNENIQPQAAYEWDPCSLPLKARNEFLRRVNHRIRWDEWLCAIKQLLPMGSMKDNQIEYFLRAHILSKALCLSNKDLPEAIFDSLALREFMGFQEPSQESLDMGLLTYFRERIQAIGLDERIECEISFLMCSSDSGHSEEQAVNMSNTDQAESTFLLEDPGAIIDPNQGLPAFWDMAGLRAQYQDIPLILPSYYPPVWADDRKRAKSELKTSADPPVGNEKGWNTADLPQLQPASILFRRTAHARKAYRHRRNLLPAVMLMTSFLVGTYFFGAELYQRVRAKSAGEISALSFFNATASPQPMPAETNTSDPISHTVEVVPIGAGLYDASEDIAKNIAFLTKEVKPAYVITSENDITIKASVTLDGLMDYDAMCQLINLAKRHKIKVSFFPLATQAAQTPYVIREITNAGFTVGNYILNSEQDMMNKPLTELVAEYTSAHRVLRVIAGQAPAQIKGDTSGYTRDMLIAAGVSGFCQAVRSTAVLTYKSFSSYEETLGWVRRLRPGSIVSVRLPDLSDPSEYHLSGWLGEAPDDPGGIAFSQSIEKNLEQARDKRLVRMVGWLFQAIEEAGYSSDVFPL